MINNKLKLIQNKLVNTKVVSTKKLQQGKQSEREGGIVHVIGTVINIK